ncbi:MAG: peptidoglycan DD-metalloendopeptidase family protein [Actinobacteria bacterium]|nr:peptidoglycan DD-metalloendopeptidase family protein [Actinomycetota bacterium]
MSLDKKEKYYTLIVHSDADSKVWSVKIHYNWLRFAFIFISIVMISIFTLVANIYLVRNELNDKIAELDRLQEKVSYKAVEIANLENKSNEIKAKTKLLEEYLAQVEDLDKMVRDITGKGGYEGDIAIYTSDLNADIDIQNDSDEIFYYDFTHAEDLDSINDVLDELIAKAPEMSVKLSQDKQHMEDHIYMIDHTPSVWPSSGIISSVFHEYRGNGHYHGGIDIANNVGTEVNAAASGVVIFAARNRGFGNEVIIHHGFGYMTVYAHLNKILVEVGQEVNKGDKIAEMGNTGYSTGPHLHYEVIKDNAQVDPMEYLP